MRSRRSMGRNSGCWGRGGGGGPPVCPCHPRGCSRVGRGRCITARWRWVRVYVGWETFWFDLLLDAIVVLNVQSAPVHICAAAGATSPPFPANFVREHHVAITTSRLRGQGSRHVWAHSDFSCNQKTETVGLAPITNLYWSIEIVKQNRFQILILSF